MKLEELLKTDCSGKDLEWMMQQLDPGEIERENAIFKMSQKLEADTGIPMEESEIGEQWRNQMEAAFPEIASRLKQE